MPFPSRRPVSVQMASAARALERGFETVLAGAGGSIAIWRVLLHVKLHGASSQRSLATAVGVRPSTLSMQLSDMERAGLIARHRDAHDQRNQTVELTASGEATFARIRSAAGAFDSSLRRGLSDEDVAELERILDLLVDNVARPS